MAKVSISSLTCKQGSAAGYLTVLVHVLGVTGGACFTSEVN